MAYQTRGRDPLLDSTMQAAIEKRGKELIGLALIGAALLTGMMLWSYTPDDPNWMLASDAPVQNWLGRFGASLSHALMMICGKGVWLIPVILGAWGLRLAGHWGEERALSRVVFAPIAVALAAVYCATLAPPPTWEFAYGLGGLFGDRVLSILLTALPISAAAGVKVLSLLLGLGCLCILAYALGFTNRELRLGLRWLIVGLILAFDMVMRVLGRSARMGVSAAQGAQSRVNDRLAERRARLAEEQRLAEEEAAAERLIPAPSEAQKAHVAAVIRAQAAAQPEAEDFDLVEPAPQAAATLVADPRPDRAMSATGAPTERRMPPAMTAPMGLAPEHGPLAAPPREAAQPPKKGLLSGLLRRSEPEPEMMPEPELARANGPLADVDGPQEDRIRARISSAIRARAQAAQPVPEPPVTRPRGPVPLILDTGPGEAPMEEPPLTAAPMPPAPESATPLTAEPLFETEAPAPAPAPQARVLDRAPVVQHQARKAQPSTRAKAEAQPALPLEDRYAGYEPPPLSLLADPVSIERHHLSDEALEENARMLESVLDDYGVKGEIVSVRPGPVVTMYELEPAPGLKASRVIGLADDIARSMSALSARVSTVPGRSVIGIELPNANREKVVLREILSNRDFGDSSQRLPLALGKDIGGDAVVANLAKMPHLLIAGTTGSGKSVAINTMILSLLYKLTPEECRLIMIDPKMLELSVYDGIPHLLSPVVTDPKKAVVALKWVVGEMEERYRKMSKMGVRNIEGYNGRVREALSKGEMFERTVQTGFDEETGDPIFETEEIVPEVLPFIVVIVDEMADLMMVAGKEIEACIQRLAQMARASGIHLIMATQRPSVDVITGTIKANFPTRISFQVTSKIDSRTILGEQGAEQLLGMGDMLYMAGGSRITRVHGPFCSDEEVEEIVTYLKGFGPPDYVGGVVEGPEEGAESDIDLVLGLGGDSGGEDALYDQAVAIVARDRKCSTSYIQRKLAIGYNKAARLVEQMEEQGVVSTANHVGKREVLVPEAP